MDTVGHTVDAVQDGMKRFDDLHTKQGILTQRVINLEEDLTRRLAALEERLPPIAPLEQEGQKQVPLEQQVVEIEKRYQQQVAELEAQLAEYRQKEKRPPAQKPRKRKKPLAKRLPTSLTSRSVFAGLHNIPDGTVATACKTGKVAAVQGPWLYNSRIIYQALGDRGKHDFYQMFHDRPDFKLCKQCPHDLPAGTV